MPTEFAAFVPFHAKDRLLLLHSIDAIRRYLRPAITRVVVIAPPLPAHLRHGLDARSVEWLDEDRVLADAGITRWPELRVKERDRSGWMKQQALKWEARRYTTGTHYAVVDADTVFVRPTNLVDHRGRTVFSQRPNPYGPYQRTYARLLGDGPPWSSSFITHFMTFERVILEELLAAIRSRSGRDNWIEALLDAIDPLEATTFSEYETYAHFAVTRFPASVNIQPCANYSARWYLPGVRGQLALARLAGAGSLSFHDYQRTLFR